MFSTILSTSLAFLFLLFSFVENSSAYNQQDFNMTEVNPEVFRAKNAFLQPPSPMAKVAELMVPGSMDHIWDMATHGLNSEMPVRKVPPPAEQKPPKPEEIAKIIMVVWDRNREIMDDPHIVLRIWTEEKHQDQTYELPMAQGK